MFDTLNHCATAANRCWSAHLPDIGLQVLLGKCSKHTQTCIKSENIRQTNIIYPIQNKQTLYTLYKTNKHYIPYAKQTNIIYPMQNKQTLYTLYKTNKHYIPYAKQTNIIYPIQNKQTLYTLCKTKTFDTPKHLHVIANCPKSTSNSLYNIMYFTVLNNTWDKKERKKESKLVRRVKKK